METNVFLFTFYAKKLNGIHMKLAIFHLRFSLGISLMLSILLVAMFCLGLIIQEAAMAQYAVSFLLAVFLLYLIWRILFQKARSSALPGAPANGQKPKPPFAPIFHPSGSRPPSLSAAAARKLDAEVSFREKFE